MTKDRRCLYASPDFSVMKHNEGCIMILRNGNKDVKTTNRIAYMCGMRKVGPLRREGNLGYYILEAK